MEKNTGSEAGEVIINTSAGKFGGGCLQIVPQGKKVVPYTLNPIFFGGRDFTFDFWTSGDSVFYTSDTKEGIHFPNANPFMVISQNFYPSLIGKSNVWRHYALVYNWTAKQLKLYENGIVKDSYTCTYQSRRVFVLTYAATNTAYPPRVDEFRFVDGLQVWTSNFTPPTEPYSLNTVNTKQPPCIGVRNQGNNFYTVR